MPVRHPAKFSDPILAVIEEFCDPEWLVVDPFAGTGKVHNLGLKSWGVELECEWASQHRRNIVGDALHLPFRDNTFHAAITSVCYGNRMADHHNARDTSRRNTYKHALGRDLKPNNAGAMQWTNPRYKDFHGEAWKETARVLRRDVEAVIILNCSNHIRKGEEQRVTDWHRQELEQLGFREEAYRPVRTQRNRQGANGHARVLFEDVIVTVRSALHPLYV